MTLQSWDFIKDYWNSIFSWKKIIIFPLFIILLIIYIIFDICFSIFIVFYVFIGYIIVFFYDTLKIKKKLYSI